MKIQYGYGVVMYVFCFLVVAGITFATADEQKDMGGWGMDDPYQQMYDANDVEQLKVVAKEIRQITPFPGMSSGVGLLVIDRDSEEEIMVHLCPTFYKAKNRIGIRPGDKISLRGYWTEINEESVIMAAKLKFNGKSLKFRLTSDGTPFWTMSPAQLQKELSGQ